MVQVPAPPTPPPAPEIFVAGGPGEWIPILGMLTGVVITGMFLMGPVGRAIGDVIRHWLGGGRKADLPADEMDDVHARLDALQQQIGELAERQDFADRMLTQQRDRQLPGPRDVAG